MQNVRKITVALSLAIMIFCSWFALLDVPATHRIDAELKRGLITFASARALNAVISVAQGTEVAIEPMGVGVNLTPGQLLDPINDLVEQFSNIMLVACVALGAQKILINVGSYWLFSMMLTISVFGWSYLHIKLKQPPSYLSKLIVILLMIRFAIPMVVIGADLLFQKFLATEYQHNQQAINKAPEQINEIRHQNEPLPLTKDNGWWDKSVLTLKDAMNKTGETLDIKKQVSELQKRAEQWTSHIVNLIVIFLLQTLVIPVLLMWILYAMVRNVFESPKRF